MCGNGLDEVRVDLGRGLTTLSLGAALFLLYNLVSDLIFFW